MNYVLMARIKVIRDALAERHQDERSALEKMFTDWLEDPNLKRFRLFETDDMIEMKSDRNEFLRLLWKEKELEFIAEGETSESTEKVWAYIEAPERREKGILSFRASLIRDESKVKLIYSDHGKCTVYDAAIHEWLTPEYDREMPVQLTRHSLKITGINGAKLSEHVIQLLEELRHSTGGELFVNDVNARVTFEPRFMMPAEKEALYGQMNRLGQEVVQLEMEPLALLAEDAFYYEVVQFESRKLKIYSMSI